MLSVLIFKKRDLFDGAIMATYRELAKIHISKRNLNLTDKLYRELIYIFFKKKSARDLTNEEAFEFSLHIRSLECVNQVGRKSRIFKESSHYEGSHKFFKNKESLASLAQQHFVETLWMKSPGVRYKTIHALRHFLENRFHVSDLRFIKSNQVSSILGAIRKISHPVN